MKLFIISVVLFLALPAFGQTICDVNGDGLGFTIADYIYLFNVFNSSPDSFVLCDLDCNMDDDDDSLTIADLTLAFLHLQRPYDERPYLAFNPADDTLKIESTETSPGDQISLPLYLSSIDTLVAYELLLKADPGYVSIEDFIPNENLEFIYSHSSTRLHLSNMGTEFITDSLFVLPGNYHLGDLIVSVNPDIFQPVTTYISFVTCPDDNFYTGLANMTFFEPILVDGEITITPTGIEDNENNDLPLAVSIAAYPNPFNSSVNLEVFSPNESQLVVYDLLGREIRNFKVAPGVNNFIWDATDNNGQEVRTGIYFVNIKGNSSLSEKKILYLK